MITPITSIEKNEDYVLYNSPFISKNYKGLIADCNLGNKRYKDVFKTSDRGMTQDYQMYNIFSLTARSEGFYIIYQQVVKVIRDFVGDSRPLWMQCWMNHHLQDEVLKWHHHERYFVAHGYVSIDPKNTVTQFKNYDIENKIGNIYLGKPGEEYGHQVVVREPYEGYRITLGFDVIDSFSEPSLKPNLSLIPIP